MSVADELMDLLDLEVSRAGQYVASVRVQFAQSEEDSHEGPAPVDLDLATIREADDPGRALTERIFPPDSKLRGHLTGALDGARDHGRSLRVRVNVTDKVPELDNLPWERLVEPRTGDRLAFLDWVLLSRYRPRRGGRKTAAAPPLDPTAAVLLANPTNLEQFDDEGRRRLLPVSTELATLARQTLGRWSFVDLADGRATKGNLDRALKARPDVLYLVCHGIRSRRGSRLLLESEDGTAESVDVAEFASWFRESRHVPRLVVLGSCWSAAEAADPDDPDVRGAAVEAAAVRAELGPLLCDLGVPAVLAMRGEVRQDTARQFLSTFFTELNEHGRLDRALAKGRQAVRDQPDWHVPTLLLRLRTGRLWARPRPDEEFNIWDSVLLAIRQNRCIPVIGPGLSDWIYGSREDLARRLAEEYRFPLDERQAVELPTVTQYVAVNQKDHDVLYDKLGRFVREAVLARHPSVLASLRQAAQRAAEPDPLYALDFDELCYEVATRTRWADDADEEPYQILASLPFRLYLSTDPVDVMRRALDDIGCKTIRSHYRWRRTDDGGVPVPWPTADEFVKGFNVERDTTALDANGRLIHRPVFYQLFGDLQVEHSLAVTEDDYFEWMFGYHRKPKMHEAVEIALSQNTLLFVGFRFEDWDLRVLLRAIKRFEGNRRPGRPPHVAVQLDPDEDFESPERARQYLAELLNVAQVEIYWGTTETFLRDLLSQARADPQVTLR